MVPNDTAGLNGAVCLLWTCDRRTDGWMEGKKRHIIFASSLSSLGGYNNSATISCQLWKDSGRDERD